MMVIHLGRHRDSEGSIHHGQVVEQGFHYARNHAERPDRAVLAAADVPLLRFHLPTHPAFQLGATLVVMPQWRIRVQHYDSLRKRK